MEEIFTRRSIRKYKDIPVEKEKINTILAAAMQAPTACNQQDWQFVVVEDKQILEKLSQATTYGKPMGRCAVGIVVCADIRECSCEAFWQQDCGAAVENILLEAHHLGLGGVWMGVAPMEKAMNNLREILDIPVDVFPFCMISLGYPDEKVEPVNRFDENKIHYNRY